MRRISLMMAIAVLAAASLMAADVAAPTACCKGGGVERAVTKLENGIKVTMTAKDPQAVAMIQQAAATCSKDKPCCNDCPMAAEGVTRTVEKTASGVVITATATDPELVKRLQAHAATMGAAEGMKGCCKGKTGSHGAGMDGRCPYAKGDAKQS